MNRNRKSWSLRQHGSIRLGDEKPPDATDIKNKIYSVPKAALEEGVLQLLASAAEMQQRQDLDSALQLYEAAMEKVKAHNLNRKRLFTGTTKKPPPLNNRTPIEWCLHVGDMASAVCLLGNPNAALAELCTTVSLDRIEQVLEAGADIEYRMGPMGRTLLLQEAAEGRHPGVHLALSQGANVNCMDNNGDTALALALASENADASLIVRDLMEAGADITSRDGQGRSLFTLVVAQGRPDVVAQVIAKISPLKPEHHGQMKEWAADISVNSEKWSTRTCDVLRLLLNNGLEPNIRLQNKALTLLEAALQRQTAGVELLVADLLDHGAEPNLEAALRNSTSLVIELILTKITPLTETHRQQMTAWITTLPTEPKKWLQRDTSVLKALLDFGLDPNIRRLTAPHSPLIVCAASTGDLSLVQKLIVLKARLDETDDNSNTALLCASKLSNRPIYDALKNAGVNDRIFFGIATVWGSHNSGT